MTKILLAGAGGTMGRTIAACVNERDDCMVVAGFDKVTTMTDASPFSKTKRFYRPGGCNY